LLYLVFNVRDGFVFRHVNKHKAFISVCKGLLSTFFLISIITNAYLKPEGLLYREFKSRRRNLWAIERAEECS